MRIGPQRPVNPDAIVAPQGYRVEALITGLTFPSAISFGPGGEIYLAESGGVAGFVAAVPRVLRIDPDQSVNEIGRLDNPIMGLVYRNGGLLIGEDGPAPRILRVTAEGEVQTLIEGLPGGGDYGLSGLSLDPNGALLFGVGTRTNSGVVGQDNLARGWVTRNPDWADVPGSDVELAGVNYVTAQPSFRGGARAITGGFRPFGRRSEAGDVIRGSQWCGGAIYRLQPDQDEPERLAWGLRNPVGVSCDAEGRVFATEGGMEERGSRPIAGAPDNLWEIDKDAYYGWPDYAGGLPVTDARFRLPGHPQPRALLRKAPPVSASPLASFPARSGVGRFDFAMADAFGFVGDALVALSGEWSTAAFASEDAAPNGYRVVRVNPRTGETTDFLVNRQAAPSSAGNTGGLERPFDVRFDPTGEVLYVVDLGEVQLNREYGVEPFGGTGVVWRVTKIRPMIQVTRDLSAAEQRPVEEAPALEEEISLEETLAAAPVEAPQAEEPSLEAVAPEQAEGGEATAEELPAEEVAPEEAIPSIEEGVSEAEGEAAPSVEESTAAESVEEAAVSEVPTEVAPVETEGAVEPEPAQPEEAAEPATTGEASEPTGEVAQSEEGTVLVEAADGEGEALPTEPEIPDTESAVGEDGAPTEEVGAELQDGQVAVESISTEPASSEEETASEAETATADQAAADAETTGEEETVAAEVPSSDEGLAEVQAAEEGEAAPADAEAASDEIPMSETDTAAAEEVPLPEPPADPDQDSDGETPTGPVTE